ncbi:MAG: membrane protein insertion efficiency factor YidD [SAR202 cluster bacterium Io17-Chloro-G3]|nr:MAG: membrane protein insertion efficiency factor YidD [SAR202 cluster bacterium Io17-Chloro-G3]
MKNIALGLISVYQKTLSPFWPTTCRFYPTCSHYAYESVTRFGVIKGSWMALKRIGRCQPWGRKFGYDPLPEPESTWVGAPRQ